MRAMRWVWGEGFKTGKNDYGYLNVCDLEAFLTGLKAGLSRENPWSMLLVPVVVPLAIAESFP
ncbi:MAG: hypothetical protein CM1200mP41_36480 [Gammaproteobacteria bacterium]|nr:MAG: hypothetical protein CM1200mP41_36480 [Gammaproteobacteria bacterium]